MVIENIFNQIKKSKKDKIMLLELRFTDEEITSYLMHNGYTVETVKVYRNITEFQRTEEHWFEIKIAYLGDEPYADGEKILADDVLDYEYSTIFTQEIKERIIDL